MNTGHAWDILTGYVSEETLEDVLYSVTGFRSFDQVED